MNMDTIEQIIQRFSQYGRQPDGSVSRVFGSREYSDAAFALKEYMCGLGMKSYIDSVGNVHGIYPAQDKESVSGPQKGCGEVIIGSHLDTVLCGGMFDGLLGIAAGITCVGRLKACGIKLPYDIHIIATNGEEGNVLGGTFGSRCLVGKFLKENYNDAGGSETLKNIVVNKESGKPLTLEDIQRAEMDFSNVKCYLELHIEQGNTLWQTGNDIGVVTGIVGLRRYKITVMGKQNHSGTTRMEYRDDAMVKAAGVIIYVDELARSYGENFVATMQQINAEPNVLAVINGKVTMVLEIRSLSESVMNSFFDEVYKKCESLGGIQIEQVTVKKPVKAKQQLIDVISEVCEKNKFSYITMPSGATHDANMMALKVPVGMIFVPSKDGSSHCKEEWTDWQQCEKGAQVLMDTLLELADKRIEEAYRKDMD